jgi:hypothetical protein
MTAAAAKTFLRAAPAERLPPPALRRGAIG